MLQLAGIAASHETGESIPFIIPHQSPDSSADLAAIPTVLDLNTPSTIHKVAELERLPGTQHRTNLSWKCCYQNRTCIAIHCKQQMTHWLQSCSDDDSFLLAVTGHNIITVPTNSRTATATQACTCRGACAATVVVRRQNSLCNDCQLVVLLLAL